jgi:glycosyltransferase involved in cell wall biosynthesis
MTAPRPLFSIVTPVYNVPVDVFRDTVDSVIGQSFGEWEWILVDDCSPDERVAPELRTQAARDPRIRVVSREQNGGIVAASNDGVDLASAPFIALLDHDDLLTPDALSEMARVVKAYPDDIDYIYSDEDKMLPDGTLGHLFTKPDWSPERLRHGMYTCHFSVLRTDLVREVGGFRPGYDGSQDHDLVLRVTERARRIHHVPRVLYHWRMIPGSAAGDEDAKPYAVNAGIRAVQDQLDRLGIPAQVTRQVDIGHYRVEREPDLTTPTSIIIPTRGTSARIWGTRRILVVEAVRSILENSRHHNLEFVVVFDPDTPARALDELNAIPDVQLVLVPFTEPFNFSAKCNLGALHASGDVLVFLNDDVQSESDEVIGHLIAPLREDGVGITGPKLLFENGRTQHAGVAYGDGDISHMHYKIVDRDTRNTELRINREVTALTGACVAVRTEVFHEVGGFTEMLPLNFNDIDFSLKVRRLGLRNVWLADVVLWHFESISRVTHVERWERSHMIQRWGDFRRLRDRYRSNLA